MWMKKYHPSWHSLFLMASIRISVFIIFCSMCKYPSVSSIAIVYPEKWLVTLWKGNSHGCRSVCRRFGVGGGAPVNFGRRRRLAAGPKNRRRRGVGAQHNFFKDSRKKFVLSSKFSDDLFIVMENCNKITTQQQWHRARADQQKSAAAAPTNCRRRRGAHGTTRL